MRLLLTCLLLLQEEDIDAHVPDFEQHRDLRPLTGMSTKTDVSLDFNDNESVEEFDDKQA